MQLCVQGNISRLLCALSAVRFQGKVHQPRLAGSESGPPEKIGLGNEEYIADFCLISRRTLSEYEYRLFKFHYLLGADWKLCSRKMNLDRGTFFHEAYRIEQKLGRTFRELQPYGLFPLDEYFNGSGRQPVVATSDFRVKTEEAPVARKIFKFPVKRAA